MSDEQRRFVEHVTSDCQVAAGVGMAGTGKSFALRAGNAAWQAAGHEVVGCALAGKAAAGLEEGSGIKSQTLHSLLAELDSGNRTLSSKSVVVLDESGMVGVHQMSSLVEHVSKAGAKLIMVGDSRQLQPVEAGAPFRQICEKIGAAELSDIRRQHNEADRTAVKQLAAGRAAEALDFFKSEGRLKVASTRKETMRDMVSDYLRQRDPLHPGESLMIAATRSETHKLNSLARQLLGEQLGPGTTVETPHGPREFCEGDRVLFTRNSKSLGVKNGTLGTLERVEIGRDAPTFRVRLDDGNTIQFQPGEDWKAGQYSDLDHAYCVTAHKSQGATVDRAYVLSPDGMGGREWAYVALSRHRDEAHLYAAADQVEDLADMLSQERQAVAALDHSLDHEIDEQEKILDEMSVTQEQQELESESAAQATPAPALEPVQEPSSHEPEIEIE